mmetsp:Transcript_12175/g.33753  ORF Transcript_12175/g.33753 Transcript_12175/m.33753 type:complete len:235 (-) Transcript_12175:128-832(-)
MFSVPTMRPPSSSSRARRLLSFSWCWGGILGTGGACQWKNGLKSLSPMLPPSLPSPSPASLPMAWGPVFLCCANKLSSLSRSSWSLGWYTASRQRHLSPRLYILAASRPDCLLSHCSLTFTSALASGFSMGASALALAFLLKRLFTVSGSFVCRVRRVEVVGGCPSLRLPRPPDSAGRLTAFASLFSSFPPPPCCFSLLPAFTNCWNMLTRRAATAFSSSLFRATRTLTLSGVK